MATSLNINLPTSAALTVIADALEAHMKQHILSEGEPPGEYEQGFADAFALMVQLIRGVQA